MVCRMVQVCTSSPVILHLIGTVTAKNRCLSYMCHHQGEKSIWYFILQVSELSLLQVCLFQQQEITAVKYNICTLRNAFLMIWGGGVLSFCHTFWGCSQYVDAPVPCGGSRVVLVFLSVLIHIHPRHLVCYIYWKCGPVLICVHCESCVFLFNKSDLL